MDSFTALEKSLAIKFKDRELLQTAFTHRSYLNEHDDYPHPSNERLEFLGDAVLQLLTSEYLYQHHRREPEGVLTNYRSALVCTRSLAKEAKRLEFGDYLLLSKGEEQTGGRNRGYILANTFEALLGATYLDQDLPACRKFLERELFPKLEKIVADELYKDFKSNFQELGQEKFGVTPTYRVLKEWGLDHDKTFEVGVYLGRTSYGKGQGSSKQRAEQEAARAGLAKIGVKNSSSKKDA